MKSKKEKRMTEPLYIDNDTPDLRCPQCGQGLRWTLNLYPFNKEKVFCVDCHYVFYVTQIVDVTYKVEEIKKGEKHDTI